MITEKELSKIKTPLLQGEEVIMRHNGAYLKGMPRPSGYIILTNQRILFEKSGAMNAMGTGLLSLAMKNFDGIPLSEIKTVQAEKSVSGVAVSIIVHSGEEFKFAFNGFAGNKKSRDEMVNYINDYIQHAQ